MLEQKSQDLERLLLEADSLPRPVEFPSPQVQVEVTTTNARSEGDTHLASQYRSVLPYLAISKLNIMAARPDRSGSHPPFLNVVQE